MSFHTRLHTRDWPAVNGRLQSGNLEDKCSRHKLAPRPQLKSSSCVLILNMTKKIVPTPLEFRLPSTVESIQQGWLISCQSSALISGFLSLISVVLLILFNDPSISSVNHKISDRIQTTTEILAYASLILNISACASCFILLDRLGDVPFRAAKKKNVPKDGKISMPSTGILRVYGVGALWRWAVWHWLVCFLLGFWSIIAQILLFVWTRLSDNRKTTITISGLGAFCILPWIGFILAPLVNGLNSFRANEDEEASFGTNEFPTFSEHDPGYRLSEVGRSPQEFYRPRFSPAPVLRSPVIGNRFQYSPTAGDNRTSKSSSN